MNPRNEGKRDHYPMPVNLSLSAPELVLKIQDEGKLRSLAAFSGLQQLFPCSAVLALPPAPDTRSPNHQDVII
jgi:hypothetical protein